MEGIPRYSAENPYEYTKEDLAKRKKALIDIRRDFPKVNEQWAEWLYDVLEHTPQDEIKEIINKGLWESPPVKYKTSLD